MTRLDRGKSDGRRNAVDHSSVPREWQFSLRTLLITTAVVSGCLALGTYLVGDAFALFAAVLLQVETMFSVDWLIRPGNRRVLAFVTAGTWMITGSGMLIIGASLTLGFNSASTLSPRLVSEISWSVALGFGSAAAFCYWFGCWQWRRLTTQRRPNL